MSRQNLLLPLLFTLLVAGCATPSGHVRVIHTTDVHGHFSDGLTGVASFIDGARAGQADVLLLDSGDMWSGTLMSDRTEGELGVAAYNAMRYDAVVVGNHEFDYGPEGPERTGGADPFGSLKARIAQAEFPILSANLVDKATGKIPDWPGLKASVMVNRGGFQIGLVGATTIETPSITFPHVGEALAFTDTAAAVTREATALRKQGADLVILIAHIGGSCASFDDPDDLSSCDEDSELFALVRALPEGLVDMALGGHTHKPLAHRVNGVMVAHTGAGASHVIDANIEGIPGSTTVSWKPPIKVGPGEATSGPTRAGLEGVLAPALAAQKAQRDEVLGARVVTAMTRNSEEGSPVGSFLCDVMLDMHPDREICILNSGGIRADIPAGELTYGQLYDVMPFGNYSAVMDISGTVLLELLRLGTSGGHGVLQVGGMTVTYDPNRVNCTTVDRDGDGRLGPTDRDRLVSTHGPDGTPIDPNRTYRIVTNSFLGAGGDGWRGVVATLPVGSVRILEHLLPIREQVGAWLRDKRPILNSADNPVMPGPRLSKVKAPVADEDQRCGK